MLKTIFENTKFLPLKIASKFFLSHGNAFGRKFVQAIFNGKNFEFSKTILAIRFRRLWKMFLFRVKKFPEISKNFYLGYTIPYVT